MLAKTRLFKGFASLWRHANTVKVTEHLDTTIAFNKLARAADIPNSFNHVSTVVSVVLTKDLLNGFGGNTGIVEWDTGDKVMKNVGFNNIVENKGTNEAKLSVDSGSSTLGKVPLLVVIVRKSRIRVLKVGDENQPMVDPEVRDNVVAQDRNKSPFLDGDEDERQGSQDTQVGDNDIHKVLFIKDRRSRNKVVDHPLRVVRELLASNVGEEIHVPSKELLEDQVPQGGDWSIFSNLTDGLPTAQFHNSFPGLGYKDSVTLKVAGRLVVLRVGDSPGVVRDEKSRVEDPADNVVDGLGVRKGTVATFVGQNPAASAKETVKEAVDGPSNDTSREPRDEVDILVGEVGEKTNEKDVAEDVGKGFDVRALVAFGWDCVKDFLHGEVGDSESVAIGINSGFNFAVVLKELGFLLRGILGTSLSKSYRSHFLLLKMREKEGREI